MVFWTTKTSNPIRTYYRRLHADAKDRAAGSSSARFLPSRSYGVPVRPPGLETHRCLIHARESALQSESFAYCTDTLMSPTSDNTTKTAKLNSHLLSTKSAGDRNLDRWAQQSGHSGDSTQDMCWKLETTYAPWEIRYSFLNQQDFRRLGDAGSVEAPAISFVNSRGSHAANLFDVLD